MNDTISRQVEKSYKYSEKQLLHIFHELQEKHVKAAKKWKKFFLICLNGRKRKERKKRYLSSVIG